MTNREMRSSLSHKFSREAFFFWFNKPIDPDTLNQSPNLIFFFYQHCLQIYFVVFVQSN